jgi:hypothetical protein
LGGICGQGALGSVFNHPILKELENSVQIMFSQVVLIQDQLIKILIFQCIEISKKSYSPNTNVECKVSQNKLSHI